MNIRETIDYLTHFPVFDPKTVVQGKTRMNLDAISILLDKVGHPENRLKFIHIAGTNGKGSTAAFIQGILKQAAIQTGVFTSPYIYDWKEQIRVNDQWIDDRSLIDITAQVKEQADRMDPSLCPSAYEITVVIALLYFVKRQCELVILETGLGGQLDATNVIPACELTVMTSIGLDHTELLGTTVEEIAYQKAGIIKEGCDVILYPQQRSVCRIMQQVCQEKNARLHPTVLPENIRRTTSQVFQWRQLEIEIQTLGTYQVYNAALALSAAQVLQNKGYPITQTDMIKGCAHTQWPARFEIVHKQPTIIIDGAHNIDGVKALIESLQTYFPNRKIGFVCGILADKNYRQMIDIVIPYAKYIHTVTPDNPRALPAEILSEYIKQKNRQTLPFDTLKDCLDFIYKQNDILCMFGSLYYIGHARNYILNRTQRC